METTSERVNQIFINVLQKRKENLKNLKCETCMWLNKEFLNCKRFDIEKPEMNCPKYMEIWKQI